MGVDDRLNAIKASHEFGKGEGWELTILSEDIDWLIEQLEYYKSKYQEAITR